MPRYAAIDIGSNSVRLLVADATPPGDGKPPQWQTLAVDREVTRLGESVFRSGVISEEAMTLVCGVLARMAATYKKHDVVGVRAVATSATRDARNQQEFLERASAAVGVPVETISGQEEARLIHLGVQARWPNDGERVLLVDVGGGSAEIMLSERGVLREAFSKPLGAVRLTETFLKSDPPAPIELHRLDEYIHEKIASPLYRIGAGDFTRMIVTSATAAAMVCAIHHVPRLKREQADRLRASAAEVRRFFDQVKTKRLSARRKVGGIGPRRAEIIVAGAAVFLRIMEAFGVRSAYYSAAGVRDGIVADLFARGVGRELSQLDREQRRVVEEMARKFGVSLAHARNVADLGHKLFESLQPLHKLPPNHGKLLQAAAYLHDTGHYVSETSHHKHSAYLVANADLAGFTEAERLLIAMLCRYHRRSMPSSRHPMFQALDAEQRRVILLLTPILRIADSLDRGHEQRIDNVACEVRDGVVVLSLVSSAPDTDLEQWATEQVAGAFRAVYARELTTARARR